AKVQAAAEQTAAAVQKAAAVTAPKVATAAKAAPTEGNLAQWAKWLADQLRRVPDIQVYDALRLADLESRGPVAARGVWATAREVRAKEYGTGTIGDLLKRFQPKEGKFTPPLAGGGGGEAAGWGELREHIARKKGSPLSNSFTSPLAGEVGGEAAGWGKCA